MQRLPKHLINLMILSTKYLFRVRVLFKNGDSFSYSKDFSNGLKNYNKAEFTEFFSKYECIVSTKQLIIGYKP